MGQEIEGAFVITDSDRWAFALCALASRKVERDAILIADSFGIFETLQKLEEQGIVKLHIKAEVMPGRGWRTVDFDNWLYQLKEFWHAFSAEDKYEKGYLKIDRKTEACFLQAVAEELSFASEEKRGQILEMAKALGANELLESLEKAAEEHLGKVCAPDVNRPFLAVLIPIAHILDQSLSLYLYGIGPEITRHKNACRYCRKFLRENGLLESAV